MSWDGESIRHSLAVKGVKIRNTPRCKMYDVKGLEELEGRLKESRKVIKASIEFYDWEIVLDTSRFGEPSTKKERMNAFINAPAYILGFARYSGGEAACVFSGKGGTFTHPPLMKGGRKYPDNHYLQPVKYEGQSIMLCKPVTLESVLENGETVPFIITGLVGIEREADSLYKRENLIRRQK